MKGRPSEMEVNILQWEARQSMFQDVGWHYGRRALFSQMKQSLEFRSLAAEGNEISLEKGKAFVEHLSFI